MKSINVIFGICTLVYFGLNLQGQNPNFLWAKQMGGAPTTDRAYSHVVDKFGNVYTVGTFFGTADFNPSTDPNSGYYGLISAGGYDIFISKLDASGRFLWAKRIGGQFDDYAYSIVIDEKGFIFITGYFQGMVDFDPNGGINNLTSAGGKDIFITKLSSIGDLVWAKRMGGTSNDIGYSIAINNLGNISTTGSFGNTADFDPGIGSFNLTAGYIDIFVSTLDDSGNFLWAKRMGGGFGNGNSGSVGNFITIDNNGFIYTTGYFSATGDFGMFNLTASGYKDIFIMKQDANGNIIWVKQVGGLLDEEGKSLEVDDYGNLFITGSFDFKVDFNPSPNGLFELTTQGDQDIFILKLNSNGNFIWVKQVGGIWDDIATSIQLDTKDNIFITGYFYGNGRTAVDFNPGPEIHNLISYGNYDIFILKLDSGGNFLWALQMGGESPDFSNSIYLDNKNNIFTTGSFYGTSDFDPGNGVYDLKSGSDNFNTYEDIFISKLCQIEIPTISGSTFFCEGDSLILTSTFSNSYLWSNGDTTQSIVVKSSGNYVVTVTNESGCSAVSGIKTVFLQKLPLASINPSTATINCSTPSVILNASGGNTYLWSHNLGTNPSITVMPVLTTTYSVTVTSSNGCTDTEEVTVIVDKLKPTALITSSQLEVNCSIPSTMLEANGGGMYLWSNGLGTSAKVTVMPSVTTTYTVTVTSLNGCTDTEQITIVANKIPPIIDLGPDITIVEGQDTLLGVNIAGLKYIWSTGDTTPTIRVKNMGTYSVTVTNSNGCTGKDEVEVRVITSTKVIDQNNKIIVYPNPFDGNLLIAFGDNDLDNEVEIKLYNNLGERIKNWKTFKLISGNSTSLNLDDLPAGVYMIFITHGKDRYVKKIQKV